MIQTVIPAGAQVPKLKTKVTKRFGSTGRIESTNQHMQSGKRKETKVEEALQGVVCDRPGEQDVLLLHLGCSYSTEKKYIYLRKLICELCGWIAKIGMFFVLPSHLAISPN